MKLFVFYRVAGYSRLVWSRQHKLCNIDCLVVAWASWSSSLAHEIAYNTDHNRMELEGKVLILKFILISLAIATLEVFFKRPVCLDPHWIKLTSIEYASEVFEDSPE